MIDCMKDMKPRTNDEINQCWKLRLNTENNLAMLFFKLGKFKASFKHAEIGTKFPIIEKEKSKSFYWFVIHLHVPIIQVLLRRAIKLRILVVVVFPIGAQRHYVD